MFLTPHQNQTNPSGHPDPAWCSQSPPGIVSIWPYPRNLNSSSVLGIPHVERAAVFQMERNPHTETPLVTAWGNSLIVHIISRRAGKLVSKATQPRSRPCPHHRTGWSMRQTTSITGHRTPPNLYSNAPQPDPERCKQTCCHKHLLPPQKALHSHPP